MQLNTNTQKHFFLNTVKHTVSYFAVSLLTIILFFSCTIQPDVSIVFTITKEGQEIDTKASPLLYDNNYLLTVGTINDVAITTTTTTDYHITYEPAGAFTTVLQTTNSLSFTVNAGHTTATFTAIHKKDTTITETLIVNLKSSDTPTTDFASDIQGATVPDLALDNISQLTRNVLGPLGANAGTTLVKRYVTQNGGATTQDGTSWATAWTGANLRANINAISDATANRVYLVMIAGGTYKPTTTTSRGDSFSMKNYVAIMGGFDPAGGWARTGTTIFSGDIGTVGSANDNSYHVFFHNFLTLNNAHLYGVTITGGNANSGSGNQLYGGGMYNKSSSPVLTSVVFSGNNAARGGGMYNDSSSPILNNTRFANNTANFGFGGGMFNNNSSPVLNGAMFSGNNAQSGGGMYNISSSPEIITVVFSGNTATRDGGGMYNNSSSPVIIATVFRDNRAANGGAMENDNDGRLGPLIVNSIFSGNTLSGAGMGTNIVMNLGGSTSGGESIRIAGSVLGIGLVQPTNDIVGYNGSAALNISYHSLANGAVRFGADAIFGEITYPTIQTGSSAINRGLFVRKHVNGSTTTYYFSETEATTSWHTGFTSTGSLDGTAGNLPTTGTIEDLTATDIAGNARSGRPDAGVYELP